MRPNDLIRKKRLELGLDEAVVASRAGLTVAEYSDMEDYDDELYTVVPLIKIKRVCGELGLSLNDLFDLQADGRFPADIVKQKMQDMNMSVEDVSDFVGMTEEAIRDVARDVANAESWVMEPLLDLAKFLHLKPGNILASLGKQPR